MYQFGYLKRGNGGGFSGGHTEQPAPKVPRVADSSLSFTHDTGIVITWDQPMMMSQSLEKAISVLINGTAAVVSDVVLDDSSGNTMGIEFTPAAKKGDVITWAYDDQHPTETLSSSLGIEADNQTYGVTLVGDNAPVEPVVLSSRIFNNNPNRIVVEWDRAMKGNADTHLAIAFEVNGTQAMLGKAVIIHGKFMMITLNSPATSTDNYKWRFQATNPGAVLEDVHGTMALDTIHNVTNDTPATNPPPPADEPELDLDSDGKPDELIAELGDITITEDADSYNVDLNGDMRADIVVLKRKASQGLKRKMKALKDLAKIFGHRNG